MSDSRVEDLLDALLNGTDPPEEPKSRVEEYLYALITGTDPQQIQLHVSRRT